MQNIEIKTDCFAYRNLIEAECDKCHALRSLVCKNSNCRFYKSKFEFKKEIEALYGISDIDTYYKKILKEGNYRK